MDFSITWLPNIWAICVFLTLFIAVVRMSCFALCGIFVIIIFFAISISAGGKLSPSVKCISKNLSSSMTKMFLKFCFCGLSAFLVFFSHKVLNLTHNIHTRCNEVQENVLTLVQELTFSCSFLQMIWYMDISPTIELYQDKGRWKHTCKPGSGGHYKIS